MSERPRLVPASYVVFRRADQVLLQLRQGTGYMDGCWAAAAAGHLEAGESAVQAAVREAQEELGITIDPEQLVPLTTMHRTQRSAGAAAQRVDFFF
ncbi:MAG: NUDIX domain-containing protein, partial [Micrococcaceae bacterium]|nr:NUDIX domain-containing protein [Micrococcaceae bacterium]